MTLPKGTRCIVPGTKCQCDAVRRWGGCRHADEDATDLRCPRLAVRLVRADTHVLKPGDLFLAMCSECAAHHEHEQRQTPDGLVTKDSDPTPRAPISAPGSTVEDLENDLAALDLLLRLAEYGVEACASVAEREGTTGEETRDFPALERVANLYRNGAGGFDETAVVAWIKERITETENSIEAASGMGMPSPGSEVEG